MSRVRSKGTKLEEKLEAILKTIDCSYVKQPKIFGKPDFAYPELKIAIFADSHFWHGYNWEESKKQIKVNKDFWIPKIERNIKRDHEVNQALKRDGWQVLRFWQSEIIKDPSLVSLAIKNTIAKCLKETSNGY